MEKIKNFNRLNDYFFKNLMGQDERKALALDFLNSIVELENNKHFVDLKFLNTEKAPNKIDGKLSRLDIQAQTDDGTFWDIEVQVSREDYMPERSLFYLSRIYGNQLNAGEKYPVLKRTIGINLLNFNLDQLKTLPSWHNYCCFCVPNTNVIVTRHLEMHFLELPKVKISDIKKLKKSEQWGAYFSGKYSEKDLEELAMNNPVIKQALDYEAYFNSNDELRKEYLAREEAILDEKIRNGYSHQRGRQEGIKEGIQEGIQENKIQNAINFLKLGIDIETVAKGVNLSIEKIKELQKSI